MEFTQMVKNLNFWTSVKKFNINVENRNVQTFFGVDSEKDLPTPNVSPILWNNVHEPKEVPISKLEVNFFRYLEDSVWAYDGKTSPLDDFVGFLLGMLDYDTGPRIIHTQIKLSFYVCSSKVDVVADVAILKRTGGISEYMLLVVEDISDGYGLEEGRLIAGAIAAFCQNNVTRKQAGLPVLESRTILGMVMSRTTPTLYKILVTKDFIHQFLEQGRRPTESMFVDRLRLRFPEAPGYLFGGSLENRWDLLKHLNAFKKFLSPSLHNQDEDA